MGFLDRSFVLMGWRFLVGDDGGWCFGWRGGLIDVATVLGCPWLMIGGLYCYVDGKKVL